MNYTTILFCVTRHQKHEPGFYNLDEVSCDFVVIKPGNNAFAFDPSTGITLKVYYYTPIIRLLIPIYQCSSIGYGQDCNNHQEEKY